MHRKINRTSIIRLLILTTRALFLPTSLIWILILPGATIANYIKGNYIGAINSLLGTIAIISYLLLNHYLSKKYNVP